MKDAASIAAKYRPKVGGYIGEADDHRTDLLAAAIERYAARLVKAERKRCCGIVAQARLRNFNADRRPQFVCDDIIRAINTPAKRPSKRKGKR